MNIKIGSVAIVATILLAGCASMSVTNDAIAQRTSLALSLQPSQFTISNRVDSGIRTDYKVSTLAGKNYSCYVTGTMSVTGRVVSDAMCTEMNPGDSSRSNEEQAKSGKECNALLKAAGKCS